MRYAHTHHTRLLGIAPESTDLPCALLASCNSAVQKLMLTHPLRTYQWLEELTLHSYSVMWRLPCDGHFGYI